MNFSKSIFSFALLCTAFFSFSSFSDKKYEEGAVRYFDNAVIQPNNVELAPISDIADSSETVENKFDKILKKVIEEDRFIEKLDSSSFFSLPIGISVFDGAYALIVHESSVFADHAEFNAFLTITNPVDGKKIRFEASNVKYSFEGGISSFRLELETALSTSLFKGASMEWKQGSYAQWDCDGFDHLGINGAFKMDSSLFVQVNPITEEETENIRIDFFTQLNSLNDFVLDLSIPTFKVKGFDGAFFELNNAVLDCSDFQNASSFSLPPDYPGGFTGSMATLWRGIFINEATVYLSSKFNKNKQSSPPSFSASGLIIDDFGFTGVMTARNILELQDGGLGNWPFSIEEFSLGFFTGSFQSLDFKGEVVLPGSSSGNEYSAYFDASGAYHFEVSTGRNVDFDVFAADIELYSSSSIEVFVDNGKFVPTAHLDGKISFSAARGDSDSEILKTPHLDFQGLILSSAPPFFDVDYLAVGGVGECKLANFPITLSEFELEKRGDLLGFGFKADANLSPVSGGGITAEGKFSLLANISNSSWEFERLDIDEFQVDARKEGAFSLNGKIAMIDNDPVYGNAFYGDIDAIFGNTFSSSGDRGMKLKVAGMFGNADFGRYFFVDAFMALGSASVPAGPFMLNGFGGGLSYGMKRTFNPEESGARTISSVSGVTYLPDKNSGLGISAALQAGIVNEALLKGNVDFSIVFNKSGGINQISFYGEVAMVSPVEPLPANKMKELSGSVARGERPAIETNTPMKASVKMLMDFQKHTFDARMEVWLNVAGAIKGVGDNNRAGWAVFHHDPNRWHLFVGSPTDPVGVEFLGLAKTESYFMAGHDLPNAMLMDDRVLQILGMTQEDFNGERQENDLIKGNGLAFGTHLEISTGDLSFLIFYGAFELGAGFDVMLLDYGDYARCEGRSGNVGINGWFAKGQAYAYFAGKIGIKVKVFGRRKKFDIINIQTAAAMRLEGPNPTWFKGVVGGKYRILGGLVSGRCRFEVTAGEKCNLKTGPEKLSDMTIIAGLTPTDGSDEVDIFSLPQAVFNMPVGKELKISEDEKLQREFRINLREYSIYKDDKKINGEAEWNPEKTTLAYTPDVIFDPLSEYRIVASVSFDEKINGIWSQYQDENGDLYTETKEVTFSTSELPDEIPGDYVEFTYPVTRMVNFYKEENSNAYLIFKSKIDPFFYDVKGWEKKVRWFPIQGGKPIYADLTYSPGNKEVTSSIPAGLQNETMYRFELVNVPLSSNNNVDRNVSENSETQLAYEDSTFMDVTTRKAEGVISEQEEQVFYSLSFRTSKFNKFLEKIPEEQLKVRFLFNSSPGIDYPGATIYDTELFDGYEIGGSTNIKPLVRCSAVLSNASFYQTQIHPLLYEGYPWHSGVTPERDISEYGIPPTMPVYIWQVDYNYTLTDSDLETGNMQYSPDKAHFIYALPSVWADDFLEIRNNIFNHVDENSRTFKMKNILDRDIWPQVDKGNYPIKVEYVLPGKNRITSSKIVELKNSLDVPQIKNFGEDTSN